MAKANQKVTKELSEKITEGFKAWGSTLDDLTQSAEDSFMPLVAQSLKLTKNLILVYEQGFRKTLKEKV